MTHKEIQTPHEFAWKTFPWPGVLNRSPDCQQVCVHCGLDARCAFGDDEWCKRGKLKE